MQERQQQVKLNIVSQYIQYNNESKCLTSKTLVAAKKLVKSQILGSNTQ